MADSIVFGSFSRAKEESFVSTTNEKDFELFQEQNPEMGKACKFEHSTKLQIGLFTKGHYGKNVLEDLAIPPGRAFMIGSLKALHEPFNQMCSVLAVSKLPGILASDEEGLAEIKKEIEAIFKASEEAREKWGNEACYLIW